MNITSKIIDGHQVTVSALQFIRQHLIIFVYAAIALLFARSVDIAQFWGITWPVYGSSVMESIEFFGYVMQVTMLAPFINKVLRASAGQPSSVTVVCAFGVKRYVRILWYALLYAGLEYAHMSVFFTVAWLSLATHHVPPWLSFSSRFLKIITQVFILITIYVPVIIIHENSSLMTAIKRSAKLLWRSWLALLWLLIAAGIIPVVIAVILPWLLHPAPAIELWLGRTGDFLFLTFFNVMIVLLYMKLVQRERN